MLDITLSGGARALGFEGLIGALNPGAAVDLVVINLDSLAFTPLNDVVRQLVYCQNGSSGRHLFVDGRQVVRDAQLTTTDEPALRREVRAIHQDSTEQRVRVQAHRLEPNYRAMVLKAHARNEGMRRRLDD